MNEKFPYKNKYDFARIQGMKRKAPRNNTLLRKDK